MTKKKTSQKHQRDVAFGDTSEEELSNTSTQGKKCPHVARGVQFGRVKKSLKSGHSIITCNGCSNEESNTELPEVWLCLQCGYRGCGRMSENKHALQHFKTIHSDCHSLVLSTASGSVWCYDCDDEISVQISHSLKQCVEFVMKTTPNTNNINVPNVNKVTTQKSLQNHVIKEEPAVLTSESEPIEKVQKATKSKDVSQKVTIKGLRNLGNTCFFNAVMQNLNQTHLLFHELTVSRNSAYLQVPELDIIGEEVVERDSEKVKISAGPQFSLSSKLQDFFEKMNSKSVAKSSIIDPQPLFNEISLKCPQFRHYQQQDSHELLRQLLDNVRQEEIKRQKLAILKHFGYVKGSTEKMDEDAKKKIKAYRYYASHTIIEKVFGGLLISIVTCEECDKSSQVLEPFMDLSLPLFEEKQQEHNEQLYAMLDGGKQDRIKPLRNRKSETNSDENTHGQYIVTKPKNDGKPSKYQEKKQKQLSKKEKKRAARSARNRKNSQSELWDDAAEEQFKKTSDVIEDLEGNSKDGDGDHSSLYQTNDLEANLDNSEESPVVNGELHTVTSEPDLQSSKEAEDIANSFLEMHSRPVNTVEEHSVEHEEELQSEIKDVSKEEKTSESEKLSNLDSYEIIEEYPDLEKDASTVTGDAEVLNDESCLSDSIHGLTRDSSSFFNVSECIADDQELLNDNAGVEDKELENISIDASNQNNSDQIVTNDFINEFQNHLKISEPSKHNEASDVVDKEAVVKNSEQENGISSSSADECESLLTNCTSPKSSVEDVCSNDSVDYLCASVLTFQNKDWISELTTTLKPRYQASSLECSIYSCLSHFTKPELLTGSNKFRCENCTEIKIKKTGNKKEVAYTNANKQMLIFSPPAILTLQLKRFQQTGMSLRKINRFVEFSLILDLAPFCSSLCLELPHMSSVEDEILYSLYGIVEHSGRLTSGHYTAYVKASRRTINTAFECQFPLSGYDLEQLLHKFSNINTSSSDPENRVQENSQWFYISDTHVKEVSEAQVLKCQAYLLFYERIK